MYRIFFKVPCCSNYVEAFDTLIRAPEVHQLLGSESQNKNTVLRILAIEPPLCERTDAALTAESLQKEEKEAS